MTERAAHLVDHVFPHVPVRQWVLTIPHRFRYRIGYDHALCKRFLRVFDRALQAYHRNKTGRRDGQSGSVTFIQRFNSSLALSPHSHLMAIDGVFVEDNAHGLTFVEAGEPSKLDVAEIVSTVHARIHAELERLQLTDQDGEDRNNRRRGWVPRYASMAAARRPTRLPQTLNVSRRKLGLPPTAANQYRWTRYHPTLRIRAEARRVVRDRGTTGGPSAAGTVEFSRAADARPPRARALVQALRFSGAATLSPVDRLVT